MHFTYYTSDQQEQAHESPVPDLKVYPPFHPSDELRSLSLRKFNSNNSNNSTDSADSTKTEYITVYDEKPRPYVSTITNNIFTNSSFVNDGHTKAPEIRRSFFKPGAEFKGFQESGLQQYAVEVKFISTDLSASKVAGLLTIHNLTETHPVLTTYFDGEIIGPHHSFVTEKDEMGSCIKNDIIHWARFKPWRDMNINLLDDASNKDWYMNKSLHADCIYMRWKERFLYPDTNVTNVKGASFAGFYYACLNLRTGTITGLYFHRFTDRFQQLNLNHIPDSGVSATYELC